MIAHLAGRERALEPFGWTGRQAEWIALVCLHSGVFTRTQATRFLDTHHERARRLVHALIAQGARRRGDRAGRSGDRPRVPDLLPGSIPRARSRAHPPPPHGVRRRAHAPPALARLRDRASRLCRGCRPSPRRSARLRPSGSKRRVAALAPLPGRRRGHPALLPVQAAGRTGRRAVQCSSTSIPATTPRPRSVPGAAAHRGLWHALEKPRPVRRGRRRRPHFAGDGPGPGRDERLG